MAQLTTSIATTTKREQLTKLMASKSSTPVEEAVIEEATEVVKEVPEEVVKEEVREAAEEVAKEVATEAASSTNVERAIKVATKTAASMTPNMRRKNNTTIKMRKGSKISKETTTIVQPRLNIEPKSNTMKISITTIRISKMVNINTDKRPQEGMATTKAEVKEAMEAEEDPELNTVVKINSNSNIKIKRLILRSHMKIKRVSNLWERLVRFSLSIKKMLYRRKSKRSSLK